MTDQHPITPPPELVKQWRKDWHFKVKDKEFGQYMAERAAQWGADQELKACRLEIIDGVGHFFIGDTSHRVELANNLHDARRPKPLSLKEQALEEVGAFEGRGWKLDIIRRALEALPDE